MAESDNPSPIKALPGKHAVISSRRRAESADEAFRATIPIPSVLLDDSLRIIKVSTSYLTHNRVKIDECIGTNIFELVRTKGLDQDPTWLSYALNEAVAAKSEYTTEHQNTNGTYSKLRAVPTFRGDSLLYLLLVIQDTTTVQEATNEQLDNSETYQILVETVKDYAIFMLDTEGKVKTWNDGAALLKGYKKEEIIGQHFAILYSEEDRAARKPQNELEIALRDGKIEDEGYRFKKDGTSFWANVIITCVIRDGVHIGFSKVTRDLTERKAAEARVIAGLEEASRLKSQFLANTSHEMRTPLHGILSALTLLMDTSLTRHQRELSTIIQDCGATLLQIINDILDSSKLSSGMFSISTTDSISISETVRSIARNSQSALNAGVKLEVILGPDIPIEAFGDPLRFHQVIQNLVTNAIKFTDSGFIKIHTSLVEENTDSYLIRTEVIDTGVGIANNVSAESLFVPFTQFDASSTKRFKGTGLGLSICKSLAELMGGSIGFRPNPLKSGSIFWFTAKLRKLNALKGLEDALIVPTPPPRALTDEKMARIKDIAPHKRLLLVEDNLVNQKVLALLLKSLCFSKVDLASNGEEAVTRTVGVKSSYDLILMDISMPVLDGVSATIQLRGHGINVPIIATTANTSPEDIRRYLAHDMNDHLSKPIKRIILAEVLLKWLK